MSTRAPATGVSLPSSAFILTLPSIWVSPACASALVDNNAATAAHLIAILRGVLSIIPLPDQRRHFAPRQPITWLDVLISVPCWIAGVDAFDPHNYHAYRYSIFPELWAKRHLIPEGAILSFKFITGATRCQRVRQFQSQPIRYLYQEPSAVVGRVPPALLNFTGLKLLHAGMRATPGEGSGPLLKSLTHRTKL